jgi:hypothetical protein
VEDPARPHACPAGGVCVKPGEPGGRIGDAARTDCVASGPLGGRNGEGEGNEGG